MNTVWGSWGGGWGKDHEGRWLVKLANDRGYKKGDTFFFIYNFLRVHFISEPFIIIILIKIGESRRSALRGLSAEQTFVQRCGSRK